MFFKKKPKNKYIIVSLGVYFIVLYGATVIFFDK